MSVVYHPDNELLTAYAAGAGGEAESLLVGSHVALCPRCRGETAILETVGGVLLDEDCPLPVTPDLFDAAMARIDTIPAEGPRPSAPDRTNTVPAPLRRYIGDALDEVRWRYVTHGLSYRKLINRGSTRAYLTKSAPGAGIGPHTHRGNELTLVLAGGFSDADGHYERGDLIAASPSVRHSPLADPDGFCITLAMTDAPLVFPSWGAGLVARIFGF